MKWLMALQALLWMTCQGRRSIHIRAAPIELAFQLLLDQPRLGWPMSQQRLAAELFAPERPNPSLERPLSGMPPRPPSAVYHVALVGRGAMPPRSAQLKR